MGDVVEMPSQARAERRPPVRGFGFQFVGRMKRHAPEFLVDALVEEGSFVLLVGEPGSGKSAIAADAALHVATGRRWFGREVQKGAVIYAAGERRAVTVQRLQSALGFLGLPDDVPIAILEGTPNLCDENDVASLVASVRDVEEASGLPVKLVVIDTLARAIVGADENSAKEMGVAVAGVDVVRSETGAALLALHHASKAGSSVRGSSALRGAADAVFAVIRRGETRVVRVDKANTIAEGDALAFRLIEHDGTVRVEDVGGRPAVGSGHRALPDRHASVLAIIESEGGRIERSTLLERARASGLVKGNPSATAEAVRKALIALRDTGRVIFDQEVASCTA